MTGGQDHSGDAVRQLLAEIQQRADAATRGPWEVHDWPMPGSTIDEWYVREISYPNLPYHQMNVLKVRGARHASKQCCWPPSDTDAAFIAAARSDVPRLVAALTAVLDIHDDNGHGWCQGCPWDNWVGHGWTTRIEHCRVRAAVAAALGEQP